MTRASDMTPWATPPPIVRRRSRIHGWGVFAAVPIPRNIAVGRYTGEIVTRREMRRRSRRYLKIGRIWLFRLDERRAVDGSVGGNLTRFVNHACRPNCFAHVMGDEIWIRTARDIRRGEELTIDYGAGSGTIQCRCRRGCRRML